MSFSRCELFASGRGQFVITGFAIVIGHAPFRRDPPLSFQTVKGGIKRSLLDVQNVLRHLLDPIGDGEAVPGIMLERFQDQHVECSVDEVRFFFRHKIFQA